VRDKNCIHCAGEPCPVDTASMPKGEAEICSNCGLVFFPGYDHPRCACEPKDGFAPFEQELALYKGYRMGGGDHIGYLRLYHNGKANDRTGVLLGAYWQWRNENDDVYMKRAEVARAARARWNEK
jgi:hypothetical protein